MEHVILVAFQMKDDGGTRADAEADLTKALQSVLTSHGGPAECWWVAEDDRHDGSDNDSAVFVYPGTQERAAGILVGFGLTGEWNIVERKVRGQFETPEDADTGYILTWNCPNADCGREGIPEDYQECPTCDTRNPSVVYVTPDLPREE